MMMDHSIFVQESSVPLPNTLRLRLTSSQIKFLEFLAKNTFPCVSTRCVIGDSNRESVESWEELLTALTTEDAVAIDGQLKLVPVFVSLPSVVQIRFLTFLSSVVSRVSSHVMKTFVDNVRKYHHQNLWLEAVLGQLQNTIDGSSTELNTHCHHGKWKYKFSSASETMLKDVLSELDQRPSQVGARDSQQFQASKQTKIIKQDANSSYVIDLQDGTTKLSQCLSPTVVDVDVIVIDDDSEEDPVIVKNIKDNSQDLSEDAEAVHKPVLSSSNCDPINKQVLTRNNPNVFEVSENERIANAYDSSKNDFTASDMSVTHKKRNTSDDKDQQMKTETHEEEPIRKRLRHDDNDNANLTIILESGDSSFILQEDNFHISSVPSVLPENVQACLGSLRDACSSEAKECRITTDMLSCLVQLNELQMKEACVYLSPQHFTETALLIKLQSSASQTLLTAVKSVAKIQPKVMIDVVTKILHTVESGEYVCQVLASACKDSFPHDTVSYLIRQLYAQGLPLNEDLVVVLQILIDKRADLDPDTLSDVLSQLQSGAQEMASNAKVGKLIMGVISKFGKKMSPAQLATTCALVDGHTSRLKRSLQAALKRIT